MGEDPLRWGLMRLIEEIQGRSSTLALTSGLEGRPGSGHSMNSERYDAVCEPIRLLSNRAGGLRPVGSQRQIAKQDRQPLPGGDA
jgi:hypothetical protein